MKTIVAVALAFMWSMGTVHAAEEKKTPQQEKMKLCNQQAKEQKLKGDDRKAFMSKCLKGDKSA